jgi:RNA recognition motif-containing protein
MHSFTPHSDIANTEKGRLFVAGVPLNWLEVHLESLFKPFGEISVCRIIRRNAHAHTHTSTHICAHANRADDSGKGVSRGQAIVQYAALEESRAALLAMNGYVPPGGHNSLTVRYAHSEEEKTQRKRPQQRAPPSRYSPYGGGAPSGYPPSGYPDYAAYSAGYASGYAGAYPSAAASAGYASGPAYPSGYGAAPAAAPSGPPAQSAYSGPEINIFVGNLPLTGDDAFLYKLFGPYGAISRVHVMKEADGTSKGFGFVCMINSHEAANAVQYLHRSVPEGCDRPLAVNFKREKGGAAPAPVGSYDPYYPPPSLSARSYQ